MKLWTMLAGLAVAGMLATGAFAQEGGMRGGKGGKGGMGMGMFTPPATYDELVTAKLIKDGDPVTQDVMEKNALAKLPADPAPTDEQKTAAKTMADGMWVRICGAVAPTPIAADAAPTAKVAKADYTAALAAMPMGRGGPGGPGGGMGMGMGATP
jgi:hypothetical protein